MCEIEQLQEFKKILSQPVQNITQGCHVLCSAKHDTCTHYEVKATLDLPQFWPLPPLSMTARWQVWPHPLKQHFWPFLHMTSLVHSSKHARPLQAMSSRAGQAPWFCWLSNFRKLQLSRQLSKLEADCGRKRISAIVQYCLTSFSNMKWGCSG